MHEIAEIVIPHQANVLNAVTEVMKSFCRENDDGTCERHADWWDFWIIGGRWSGCKLEASLDPEKLQAFRQELIDRQVTVSSLTAGKQELQPASQSVMVDQLWREWFPGKGEHCTIFKHARDQYRRDGFYADDVCTIAEVPERLQCERLIVAGPCYDNPLNVKPVRMLVSKYWNGIQHQKTDFDGNVKRGIEALLADPERWPHYMKDALPRGDWLVVTVDYHN